MPEYDVIIVGGGPAGAASALVLCQDPRLRVAIVDQGGRTGRRIGETIPPAARTVLDDLGVWDTFDDAGHLQSHGTSSCWGHAEPGYYDFFTAPYGRGWHLDRAHFDAMLLQQAKQRGTDVIQPAKLIGSQKTVGGWSLTLEGDRPRQIASRCVIDASGRRAAFAGTVGARSVRIDDLCGVCVFFSSSPTVHTQDSFTLVEADADGWWYSASLPNNEFVAAYMTDGDLVSRRGLLQDSRWLSRLQSAPYTARRLGGATPITAPQIIAAGSRILDRISGPGWLAVGDAASTWDPLSSQGILKALAEGIDGAKAVQQYLTSQENALAKCANRVETGFEAYLETRETYYRLESRWPEHEFWKRRRPQISLDPHWTLISRNNSSGRRFVRGMADDDLRLLSSLCETPRPAHDVVAEFRGRTRRPYSDRRIVLIAQDMVDSGRLEVLR